MRAVLCYPTSVLFVPEHAVPRVPDRAPETLVVLVPTPVRVPEEMFLYDVAPADAPRSTSTPYWPKEVFRGILDADDKAFSSTHPPGNRRARRQRR